MAQSRPVISQTMVSFKESFNSYIDKMCKANPTYALWNSYMEMVQILLTFIRATRQSDWLLHLSSLRMMLPYFFAYDRPNYYRSAPAYWLEMINLAKNLPELHLELCIKGNWTVQRQSMYPFASIAADQAIEQTVNRESKMSGGLTGISLSPAAVHRWIMAQPERSAVAYRCSQVVGLTGESRSPKSQDKSRMAADEAAIGRIQDTIRCMIHPFTSEADHLICISSGAQASDDIQSDLLHACSRGEKALKTFIDERLVAKSKDYFAPIVRESLKTFGTVPAKKKQGPLARTDQTLFSRLLIVAQVRNIDLPTILSYPRCPVSLPLASADGTTINKTTKSDLLHQIQADCSGLEPVELNSFSNSAVVVDGMALIQALPRSLIPGTFGELASLILSKLEGYCRLYHAVRVDFVGDTYNKVSIKNTERERRAHGNQQLTHIFGESQQIPKQWTKFLSLGANKEALLSFLVDQWKISTILQYPSLLHQTRGMLAALLYSKLPTMVNVVELCSNHEEADTRMLLHSNHAALSGHSNVIIRSPDTDVAVIAISVAHQHSGTVLLATGTGKNQRVLHITNIAKHLGQKLSNSMLAIHALSGCDTTSGFHGKGKKRLYNLVKQEDQLLISLSKLGESFQTDITDLLRFVEPVVIKLYNSTAESINEARYELFTSTAARERALPPTQDALGQHVLRANYQASVWRQALKPMMELPTFHGHGWNVCNGNVLITWIKGPFAPEQVLQLNSCSCRKTKCKGGRCTCLASGLRCTPLCKCVTCENTVSASAQGEPVDDEDD